MSFFKGLKYLLAVHFTSMVLVVWCGKKNFCDSSGSGKVFLWLGVTREKIFCDSVWLGKNFLWLGVTRENNWDLVWLGYDFWFGRNYDGFCASDVCRDFYLNPGTPPPGDFFWGLLLGPGRPKVASIFRREAPKIFEIYLRGPSIFGFPEPPPLFFWVGGHPDPPGGGWKDPCMCDISLRIDSIQWEMNIELLYPLFLAEIASVTLMMNQP